MPDSATATAGNSKIMPERRHLVSYLRRRTLEMLSRVSISSVAAKLIHSCPPRIRLSRNKQRAHKPTGAMRVMNFSRSVDMCWRTTLEVSCSCESVETAFAARHSCTASKNSESVGTCALVSAAKVLPPRFSYQMQVEGVDSGGVYAAGWRAC